MQNIHPVKMTERTAAKIIICGLILCLSSCSSHEAVITNTSSNLVSVVVHTDIGESFAATIPPGRFAHFKISGKDKQLWIVAKFANGRQLVSEKLYVTSQDVVSYTITACKVNVNYEVRRPMELEFDTQTLVTIVGIAFSSILATIGLLLNFKAMRRNNRIAVSTKLAELSKLLSDELVTRVEMYGLMKKELEDAQSYPDTEIAAPKIAKLQELIEANLKRQSELDAKTKYLEDAFLNLDKVDVGGVDAQIARSYRFQRIAESGLGLAKQLKE